MIVEIRNHPRNRAVVLAKTPPDLAKTMGLFAPARWSQAHGAYLVEADQVANLETFLRVHGSHRLVDDRDNGTGSSSKGPAGPLPECANCGQPADRAAALTLAFCPDCQQPWRIAGHMSANAPGRVHTTTTCIACGNTQHGQFTGCTACGATLPVLERAVRLPLPPDGSAERLPDPMPVGQVLSEQLPIDAQEATQ